MDIKADNVISHGVDIVEVERMEKLRARHDDSALEKLFTPAELEYCLATKTWAQHLAGRFAAKEAILKAIGTGWRSGIAWTDIEILNDDLGAPVVTLTGHAQRFASERFIGRVIVSISHTAQLAIGSAIGLSS